MIHSCLSIQSYPLNWEHTVAQKLLLLATSDKAPKTTLNPICQMTNMVDAHMLELISKNYRF